MTRVEFENEVRSAYGTLPKGKVIIECNCGLDGCLGWQITREGLTGAIANLITGGCSANKTPANALGKSPIQF